MTIKLICLDADDTLWHNERLFKAAEEALLSRMGAFTARAAAKERLSACATRNLELYGYGAKSFTLSMIEALVELSDKHVPRSLVADVLATGRSLLSHPVELFDGVAATLEQLSSRGRLVLITKGDLRHQEAKVAASGVGDHFEEVHIVSDKTPETFHRLFRRLDAVPEEAVMVGDSLRSDIHPALAAGAWAAFIPQAEIWDHERAALPDHPRFRQLASFAELPSLLDALN